MPRKRGELEERLRAAVKQRIRKRGDAAALARDIGEDESFIHNYLKGHEHANLDKTVALARRYKFGLNMLTGLDPYPTFDQETEELLENWPDVMSEDTRAAVLAIVRDSAASARRLKGLPPRRPPSTVRTQTARKNHSTS